MLSLNLALCLPSRFPVCSLCCIELQGILSRWANQLLSIYKAMHVTKFNSKSYFVFIIEITFVCNYRMWYLTLFAQILRSPTWKQFTTDLNVLLKINWAIVIFSWAEIIYFCGYSNDFSLIKTKQGGRQWGVETEDQFHKTSHNSAKCSIR